MCVCVCAPYSQDRAARLDQLKLMDVHCRSAYSGKGTAESIASHLEVLLQRHGGKGKWHCSHTSDINKWARAVLLEVTPATCCVFGDAMKKLPQDLFDEVKSLLPKQRAPQEEKEQAFSPPSGISSSARLLESSLLGRKAFAFGTTAPAGAR